ncbi:MAG TPA: chorismate synthase [Lachnospiraceae bacterium]|jgi:chorismate synthase|nr:chorismate synthase [Lachnospiraceae bacterium]
MAGSTFGKQFCITTWGESHGEAIGVVIDGCPAGLPLCTKDIQQYLNKRKPGTSTYTTPRKEDDLVEILSGVFEGKTTGTPISLLVRNESHQSRDYSEIASYYRPGHADYTYDVKYGFRDYRGGGRSSGRETIGRVAAGAVAIQILKALSVDVTAYAIAIGPISVEPNQIDLSHISKNPLRMPDNEAAERAAQFLDTCMKDGDSAGGMIECRINGFPAGIGEPVFDKLEANLAKAVMSIGAVKSFEIGDGIQTAQSTGSANNDAFIIADGKVKKTTNHAGGILGGISDGSEILFRCAIKPTPSISKTQQTINQSGEEIDVSIKGRHDPIIVPRAVPVIEAMAAITLVDLLFCNTSAQLNPLIEFYSKKQNRP